MDIAFLRSVALKGLYVVIAAAATAIAAYVTSTPEMSLWTMDTLKLAVITAVVAAVKKWVANMFVIG